jgi:hypothetical protein
LALGEGIKNGRGVIAILGVLKIHEVNMCIVNMVEGDGTSFRPGDEAMKY